ncbi:unnamed protein product [Candidula unifasciata]|uniref:Sigma intracellular receptor 2 n=1 Tax=Candidula unifasciata TaxID=100452 RepID=A0A8S4A7N8_9EUPU|nr:unnamed protein product [Candidula unifasciata]
MPAAGYRGVDYLLFGYFLIQIPATLLFDTQGVYGEWLYPSFLRSLRHHYLETYKDPFLANAWNHPWFLSFCLLEHYLAMPFYVWAAYCYYYGAVNKPVIVIPALIYSVHTITAVIAIWTMALLADFSKIQEPAPTNFTQRLLLCFAYSPFFIVPMVNAVDSFLLTQKRKND